MTESKNTDRRLNFDSPAQAYVWLDGHINYERNLGQVQYGERAFELEGFRALMARLGDPHRGLKTIHIAGSAGKGSSALFLEAILKRLGLRTATYTSPHLREYRERIRIDGRMIGPDAFCRALATVANVAEENRSEESGEASPNRPNTSLFPRAFKTVFEHLTATFFIAARDAGVDWMIVETGLGGRLDATNVLDAGPVLWTRIGLEHTHLLGDTIAAIAGEKAAILKPGGWAIIADQGDETAGSAVFEKRGRDTNSQVMHAESLCPLISSEYDSRGMRLVYRFGGDPLEIRLPLLGPFLTRNLQGVLAVIDQCVERNLIPAISPEELRAALTATQLPGRMEPVPNFPGMYADGGHCPPAAAAIAETMRAHFGSEPAVAVVGMVNDKDHKQFLAELAKWPGWKGLVVFSVPGPRGERAETLANAARELFRWVEAKENLADALEFALRQADTNGNIILTGSTYSVASVIDWGLNHGPQGPTDQIGTQAGSRRSSGNTGT